MQHRMGPLSLRKTMVESVAGMEWYRVGGGAKFSQEVLLQCRILYQHFRLHWAGLEPRTYVAESLSEIKFKVTKSSRSVYTKRKSMSQSNFKRPFYSKVSKWVWSTETRNFMTSNSRMIWISQMILSGPAHVPWFATYIRANSTEQLWNMVKCLISCPPKLSIQCRAVSVIMRVLKCYPQQSESQVEKALSELM